MSVSVLFEGAVAGTGHPPHCQSRARCMHMRGCNPFTPPCHTGFRVRAPWLPWHSPWLQLAHPPFSTRCRAEPEGMLARRKGQLVSTWGRGGRQVGGGTWCGTKSPNAHKGDLSDPSCSACVCVCVIVNAQPYRLLVQGEGCHRGRVQSRLEFCAHIRQHSCQGLHGCQLHTVALLCNAVEVAWASGMLTVAGPTPSFCMALRMQAKRPDFQTSAYAACLAIFLTPGGPAHTMCTSVAILKPL